MDGKLKIDELVSRTFTLAQVNEAYEALKECGVARSVVKFSEWPAPRRLPVA